MTPENPEEQWFRLLLEDSEAALQYFYKKYIRFIEGYVRPIVDDTAEAEDIASAVFQKLWEKRKTLKSLKNLEGFLYLAARNLAFNHLKKQKTVSVKQREWMAVSGKEEKDFIVAKDSEATLTITLQEIYQRAATLPPACREIFVLYYRQGKKAGEIAEQLQINIQTVYNQLSKAVGVLRKTLKEKRLLG